MKPVMVGDTAVLPTPDDNVAIAVRETLVGSQVVPEGHRFAVVPVESGAPLLSWGLPFGYATQDIAANEYLCTERMLEVLRLRRPEVTWPSTPNFVNRPLDPYELEAVVPGTQVPLHDSPTSFLGYPRSTGLAGTRNHIVVLGTTSRTGPFADALAREFGQPVVAVAHTEGGESGTPNNLELLRRTLEGFVVHPNVGALLIADDADAVVPGSDLADYARAHGHLDPVVLSYDDAMRQGAAVISSWLPSVSAVDRVEVPAAQLRIALQCGGSDAFSGVSANPLAASVAGEAIRHGGSAVLAETDELIGAESYVLSNVRSAEVARQFLAAQQAFRARVEAHGHTAEGNVSGGNIMRGLYNVTLKSLGAARKRDPRVRLDYVVDYGERLSEPGYYFMDSPGNDLESVAGEVASGCNLIFFTTGNGSVTNFPFVPTVKFVSTSGRYRLLPAEMDVNAGELLEGESLDDVTARVFDLTVRVASGEQTAGERAGHSQVSIWRNWQQTTPVAPPRRTFSGKPLSLAQQASPVSATWSAVSGAAADRVGLVLPTSICAGQVAVRICSALAERFGTESVSRFVALPHTEGCGATVSADEDMWGRTALGYLSHPSVGAALLLEHGCEITHNDFFRSRLRESGLPLDRFGWASIQLDGGMESVTTKVVDWFAGALAALPPWSASDVDLGRLRVAVHAEGALDEIGAAELASLVRGVIGSGGTVVLPQRSGLWSSSFASVVSGSVVSGSVVSGSVVSGSVEPTIPYGGVAPAGLHLMETPTDSWLETATGLGATGVDLMVVHVAGRAVAAHRLVPVLQVSSGGADDDIDLALPGGLLDAVLATASRRYVPKLTARGVVGFQVSRGLFGVSI